MLRAAVRPSSSTFMWVCRIIKALGKSSKLPYTTLFMYYDEILLISMNSRNFDNKQLKLRKRCQCYSSQFDQYLLMNISHWLENGIENSIYGGQISTFNSSATHRVIETFQHQNFNFSYRLEESSSSHMNRVL